MKPLKILLVLVIILASNLFVMSQTEYLDPIHCAVPNCNFFGVDVYQANVDALETRIRNVMNNSSYPLGTWNPELSGAITYTKVEYTSGFEVVVVRPDDEEVRPGVMVAPGGGFVGFDEHPIDHMDNWAADLAIRGYVVFYYRYAVGWDNAEGDPMEFDACVVDVNDPVCFFNCDETDAENLHEAMYNAYLSALELGNFIIEYADSFDVDVDSLFAGGHSAGGFVSNFLGSAFYLPHRLCETSLQNELGIRGIVSSAAAIPTTNLYLATYPDTCNPKSQGTYPEYWANFPTVPTLFFHGVNDDLIPYNTEKDLLAEYQDDDRMFGCPDQLSVHGSVNIANILRNRNSEAWTVLLCNMGHFTATGSSGTWNAQLRERFDVCADFFTRVMDAGDLSTGPTAAGFTDPDNIYNVTVNGGSWDWAWNDTSNGIGSCPANIDFRLAGCGKAIDFDGADDQVKIIHNGDFNVGNGPFTVEMQIQTTTTKTNTILLCNNLTGNAFAFDGIYVGLETGRIYVNIYTNATTNRFLIDTDGDDLRDGDCHHVAVTRGNDDTLRLYVDGAEVETGYVASNINMSYGNNFFLGNTNFGGTALDYDGIIDELRYWIIQRSQTQIDTYKDSSAVDDSTGLGGWWRFDSSTDGQTFDDFGGSGIVAYLGNSASVEGTDATWEEFCCTALSPKRDRALTDVEEEDAQLQVIAYPNPFSEGTIISYVLPQDMRVSIKVYNLLGKEVKTLVDSYLTAGRHQVIWGGDDHGNQAVSAGSYIYQVIITDLSGNDIERHSGKVIKF